VGGTCQQTHLDGVFVCLNLIGKRMSGSYRP
jgi:hypothetical protein